MRDLLGPFHEGERAAQRAAGEQAAARQNGVIIADALMEGARTFLRSQQMLVVATRDMQVSPWASIIFGRPGFVQDHDDGQSITIDRTLVVASDADILWTNIKIDAPIGLLAIDLSTRRRLRVNGHVTGVTDDRVIVHVDQAFPNCPKYIQRRRLRTISPRDRANISTARAGHVADEALLAAVREADTCFIASGHPARGLDASHRGGSAGFIQVLTPGVLRIPDYAGNSMFNTWGNLMVDPRCGVTVLDFDRGLLYQMTGTAQLNFGSPSPHDHPACTGRFWDFHIQQWRSSEVPASIDWQFIDSSQYNPGKACDSPSGVSLQVEQQEAIR